MLRFCPGSTTSSKMPLSAFLVPSLPSSSFSPSTCLRTARRPVIPISSRRLSLYPRPHLQSSPRCSSTPSPSPSPSSPPDRDTFRRTRKYLTVLASVGVLETLYLTIGKLFVPISNMCKTAGCVEVLSGPYSVFLGIPLTALGAVAYSAFAALAAYPLFAAEADVITDDDGSIVSMTAEEVYAVRDAVTRPLLLALASIMFVFSGYFMWILAVVVRDTCPYCVFSAGLSTTLFVLTAFVGKAVTDAGLAAKISGGAGAFSAAAAAAVFVLSSPGGLLAQMPSSPQPPPAVVAVSGQREVAIGKMLKKRGAKMYGAYWCSHCHEQKERLGKKAFSKVMYVECDKGGVDTQAQLCREKRIPGYPTWEIDGELYPGELGISDLENLAQGLPLSTEVIADKK